LETVLKVTRATLQGDIAPKFMWVISEEKNWVDFKNIFNKKVLVTFICPVTLTFPRNNDGKIMGYENFISPEWITKHSLALNYSLEVLKIVFALGRFAGLNLPNIVSVGKSTNVFKVFKDNLLEHVEKYELGGESLAKDMKEVDKALGQHLTITFQEGRNIMPQPEVKAFSPSTIKRLQQSYQAVKEIASDDVDFFQTGLVKSVADDGSSEYVLNKPEVVSLHRKRGENCLGLSSEKLEKEMILLNTVVKKGTITKVSAHKKTEEKFVILRKN